MPGFMPPALPDQLEIHPLRQPFDTVVRIPGSKSLTNRALLLAALAEGQSTLTNVLFADDTRVMIDALRQLGVSMDIDEANTTVAVTGCGGRWPVREADLFLGNAGTAMRFLTAACCLGPSGSRYRLHGIPRMHQRPIGELVDLLRQLGANIDYDGEEGFPPLTVHGGGLRGGKLQVSKVISSQYVSAMLQIGPYCGNGMALHFSKSMVSWPYVVMTTKIMTDFGADIPPYGGSAGRFIAVNPTPYSPKSYYIEPDASNASYFLTAAAIYQNAKVTINGLGIESVQGDADFARAILHNMGAQLNQDYESISIIGSGTLQGINESLHDMPDMAQTLAALAVLARTPTVIRNVGNLRVKETDRMAAIRNELTKLGATVEINGDDIHITPPSDGRIKPAVIETYDDHRMAMSFAVIGLAQPGVTIADPACVNKTFPNFWRTLNQLAPAGETVVDLPDAVESAG